MKKLQEQPIWTEILSKISICTGCCFFVLFIYFGYFKGKYLLICIGFYFFAQALIIWREDLELKKLRTRIRVAYRAISVLSGIGAAICFANAWPIADIMVALHDSIIANLNWRCPDKSGCFSGGNGQVGGAQSYFGWVLAVLGMVIGFVVNLLYGIARDAKEQVDSVKEIIGLDFKMKEAKINILKMDATVYAMQLRADFESLKADKKYQNAGSILATTIKIIGSFDALLQNSARADMELSDLSSNRETFEVQLANLHEEKAKIFISTKMAEYVEAVYSHLYEVRSSGGANSEKYMGEVLEILMLCKDARNL